MRAKPTHYIKDGQCVVCGIESVRYRGNGKPYCNTLKRGRTYTPEQRMSWPSSSIKRVTVGPDTRTRVRRIEELEQSGKLFKGSCEVCNKKIPLESVHVDHDHATGLARGYLCRNCNLGLGHFKDSVEALQKAIKYLER